MSILPGQHTGLENLQCAICIDLLCQPVSLSCSHTFCRKCLVDSFKKEDCLCPLCRNPVPADFDPAKAPICRPIAQHLERHCTVLYEQRLVELAAAAARTVHLRIGNRYELTENWKCPHKWTVFVELEELEELRCGWRLSELVEKVRFGLVPACKVSTPGPTRVDPTSSDWDVPSVPFELIGTSWGLFTVHISVFWKEWLDVPPLQLEHFLRHGTEAGSWTYGLDLGSSAELCAEGLERVRLNAQAQIEASSQLPEVDHAPAQGPALQIPVRPPRAVERLDDKVMGQGSNKVKRPLLSRVRNALHF